MKFFVQTLRKREMKSQTKQNPPTRNFGTWSQEEASRFEKALEKYGRNYSKISMFMKTRDYNQVR